MNLNGTDNEDVSKGQAQMLHSLKARKLSDIQSFTAILITYLLIPSTTEAALIRATVEGTVGGNDGITEFMNGGSGSNFTLWFDFDDSAADLGSAGTNVARFEAVSGVQIDGFDVVQSGSNQLSFSRQATRDLVSVGFGGFGVGEEFFGSFSGLLPFKYWGGGPYTADQLSGLLITDFLSAPNVSLSRSVGSGFVSGSVESISFASAPSGSAVPEPSSAILLAMAAGVGAILYRRKRKALELQAAANSANA